MHPLHFSRDRHRGYEVRMMHDRERVPLGSELERAELVKLIAKEADADPRTVIRVLAGMPVRRRIAERIPSPTKR